MWKVDKGSYGPSPWDTKAEKEKRIFTQRSKVAIFTQKIPELSTASKMTIPPCLFL
jgi:hypothetical protein